MVGGRAVINSSLVKEELFREDIELIKVPANETAERIGSSRIANMIALGAWVKKTGVVEMQSLIGSFEKVISSDKLDLLSLNEKALREGEEFVS